MEREQLEYFLPEAIVYTEEAVCIEVGYGNFWKNKDYVTMENKDIEHRDAVDIMRIHYLCAYCETELYTWVNEDIAEALGYAYYKNSDNQIFLSTEEDFMELWDNNEEVREHLQDHLEIIDWLNENPLIEPITNGSIFYVGRIESVYRKSIMVPVGFEYVGDINKIVAMKRTFMSDSDLNKLVGRNSDIRYLASLLKEIEKRVYNSDIEHFESDKYRYRLNRY